ncbi:MAG: twin-arginine translocase TatA/TatE family subunit [Shimia sp.]
MTAFATTALFVTNIPPVGWLLIAVVVLVLFGRGKISSLMGEVGKGITSFKKGVKEGTEELEREDAAQARDVTPDHPAEADPVNSAEKDKA